MDRSSTVRVPPWAELSENYGHRRSAQLSAEQERFMAETRPLGGAVVKRRVPSLEEQEVLKKEKLEEEGIFENPILPSGKEISMSKLAFKKFKYHPHDSRLQMLVFKGKSGKVKCSLEQLRSNCGIAFLSSPHWNPKFIGDSYDKYGKYTEKYKAALESLYEEFHQFIMLHSDRNKIMVSDRVDGHKWFNFYRHNKWREGEHTFNGNSNNEVVIFETDRDQLIGKDLIVRM